MNAKLLIGYDGSEFAREAIADLRNAGLPAEVSATLMTVAPVSIPGGIGAMPTAGAMEHSSILRITDTLVRQALKESEALAVEGAAVIRELFPSWKVSTLVRTDSPGTAVIQCADELKPDLIVIGARGKSSVGQAIERFLVGLGSVSHKVIRFAHCSVRIGRRSAGHEKGLELVVGVDGSAESATAVHAICSRAWPVGSHVAAIAVIESSMRLAVPSVAGTSPWTATSYEDAGGWARRAVDRAAEQLRSAGLSATAMVLEGDPKHVILREAKQRAASCVFVGVHGLNRFERFMLGSVSAAIAERAHCSVEVIRGK